MRNQFLNQVWKSYPACPAGFDFYGRVVGVSADQLTLYSAEQKRIEVPVASTISLGPKCETLDTSADLDFDFVPAKELGKIILGGDLIAVKVSGAKANQIWLLCPSTTGEVTQKFQVAAEKAKALLDWQTFRSKVFHFFYQQQFLQIDTPLLTICPGTEPYLDLFETELVIGSTRQKLFLPTSPELHLKKALALGFKNIFEIKPCFRNGEISPHHQPEFWMLEWYRAYANLAVIKQDVIALVKALATSAESKSQLQFQTLSMADLFRKYCGFNLTPQTSFQELRKLALEKRIKCDSCTDWDDLFFLIFIDLIEPRLKEFKYLFVEKYPPSQAALARLTEDGWGDRFEFYIEGVEIANAFHELNDPSVQRKRSSEDLEKKRHLHKTLPQLDEEFFQCLEFGMPPSGGIALGLERLFMVLSGCKKLEEFRLFPVKNP